MEPTVTFGDRMSDLDRIMWTIEQNPLLRSTITSVIVLDRCPDRDRIDARIDRASRRIPRLRQRVVTNPYSLAPPRWEYDPNFTLSYHLRHAHLGGDGSLRDVLTLAEPVAMQGFDKARPLWEVTVVDGLRDGRAAIIIKIHHAITDGVGAVKLMLELFDLAREPDALPELPPEPDIRVMSQTERFGDALRHELARQAELARMGRSALCAWRHDPVNGSRQAVELAESAARLLRPTPRPMSPLLQDRSLSVELHTLTAPLPELKQAARVAGGKLNDAYVAAIVLGLQHYHRAQGVEVTCLRMGMPINARGRGAAATAAGNQFNPARFEVPGDLDDPVELMRSINRRVQVQRDEPALDLLEPLAGFVGRLPRAATTALFAAALGGQDFLTSNVPGVNFPIYFEGAEVVAQYPFGPLGGAAINVTLLSYCDAVDIGVNLDPVAVKRPDLLLDGLRRGIERVLTVGLGG